MAAIDEAAAQLTAGLYAWDFSPAYVAGYTGTKAPMIVQAFPEDIMANITTYINDQQTAAILSIDALDVADSFRTLGDHLGPGAGQLQRFGTRVELAFRVTAWADQRAGGSDLVRKLAGQVEGCCFYNRVRFAAYRHLRTRSGHEGYADRASLWFAEVTVTGDGIASYDA